MNPFGCLRTGVVSFVRLVVVPWARRLPGLEALAAEHWLAWTWVERNFRILATFRACCRVKCALATTTVAVATAATAAVAVAVVTLLLACLSARRATLWIREPARRVEILLTCCEHELITAVAASKRSIAHVS